MWSVKPFIIPLPNFVLMIKPVSRYLLSFMFWPLQFPASILFKHGDKAHLSNLQIHINNPTKWFHLSLKLLLLHRTLLTVSGFKEKSLNAAIFNALNN